MVATCWTTQEFAVLRVLAIQSPGMTLDQIARGWFRQDAAPLEHAASAVTRLVKAELVEPRVVESHPQISLTKPLFAWKPSDPDPSPRRLTSLSDRARWRWYLPPVAVTIYVATRSAARLFGAFVDARRIKSCEVSHNLHLAEVFVRYLIGRPRMAAQWLGEAAFPKLGFDIKGMKDPDAFLVAENGAIERIVEFAGSYSAEHLTRFHAHCAGRAPSGWLVLPETKRARDCPASILLKARVTNYGSTNQVR